MKCDQCDKQAVVHLIEIHNGQKVEKHLCEEHAVSEGVQVQVTNAPINELLEKFVLKHSGQSDEAGLAEPAAPSELVCEDCGMSYSEFRKGALLGCPHCYAAFQTPLLPLLERAHAGGTEHLGKVPRQLGLDERRQHRLMQLRRELEDAVAGEQYERAAKLRDEVRQVEVEAREGASES
jgi:protein arginine kinase activator